MEEIDELFDGEVHSKVQGIGGISRLGDLKDVEGILEGVDGDALRRRTIVSQAEQFQKNGEKVGSKELYPQVCLS